MLYEDTRHKLLEMHLSAMANALDEQLHNTAFNDMQFEDRIGILVDAEYTSRKNNKLKAIVKKATFSDADATVEGIDYLPERKLDKEQILRLASCGYIQEKHNIIIQGATGSGKTYIANALGFAAAMKFYSVKYVRLPDLLCDLKVARSLNNYKQVVNGYNKFQLLILDEWFLYPLSDEDARDLLDIIENRYHIASTIFCSQFDSRGWHSKIQNSLLADAICDRIVHDSYTITLGGNESMRKIKGINNI